ncbi:MAG TPA: N-acetylglucosamine-6-phosphate deacetylase [Pyrinomonadaceae bacterium]|nr:N-acetylglucosamine-6-phosphate deacetylase [Pyrinomonadaceae bacterium]
MVKTIIKNARIVRDDSILENGLITIEDGIIKAVTHESSRSNSTATFDLDGRFLLPGFIDVHIHGAVGVDVNAGSAEDLLGVSSFLAANGVSSWVPTLVPDSDANYSRIIAELDRLIELQQGRPVAQAIGVHYEGVFANEAMCGALRPQYFKRFTGEELNSLPRLRSGQHMMTFAPEVEGGVELAAELKRKGWIGAIGHSRADREKLDATFDAGTRHITHLFNAMSGIHHRDLGVAGWGLTKAGVTFDIIADGVHVHPSMVKLACRAKAAEDAVLISDSVAPTGLGDGEFELWGEQLTVRSMRTQNARGSIAGSVITIHDAFRNLMSLDMPILGLAKLTAANPARLLGVLASRGSIETGKRADLVGLDENGSIRFMMIGGEIVSSG